MVSTSTHGGSFLEPLETNEPQHGVALCVRKDNATGRGSVIGEQEEDALCIGLDDCSLVVSSIAGDCRGECMRCGSRIDSMYSLRSTLEKP